MEKSRIETTPAMREMIASAAKAGLPRDQVERFIKTGYIPLEGMLPFHAAAREADKFQGPEWIGLGGKRGPGKSHTIMSQIGLDDCHRHENLKWLFLRKIKRAAVESMEDVIRRVFKYTDHQLTGNGLELPNGSRILIGGYKDAADIDKYLGIEYDGIAVEEATQIVEDKIVKLRGSLRTSKSTWRPRIYLSTNADGVGLLWFKKKFVEPARAGKETDTRFFDVTHIRNPFINAEYDAWLDSLTGALRKAWRDGDWDAFAGMAFPMWDRDLHVVDPFEVPHEWPKWRAIDEGTAAPFCCVWIAMDPYTRRQYVYREAYATELTTQQQAQRVNDMTLHGEVFQFNYADPALWQTKNRKGTWYSAADEWRDNGIHLTRADNDRINGKRKVDSILSIRPDGLPGVQIFSTCTKLIEQLGTLARSKINPEDVDTTAEDHAYDAFRYGQTNTTRVQTQPTAPQKLRHPLEGVRGL